MQAVASPGRAPSDVRLHRGFLRRPANHRGWGSRGNRPEKPEWHASRVPHLDLIEETFLAVALELPSAAIPEAVGAAAEC